MTDRANKETCTRKRHGKTRRTPNTRICVASPSTGYSTHAYGVCPHTQDSTHFRQTREGMQCKNNVYSDRETRTKYKYSIGRRKQPFTDNTHPRPTLALPLNPHPCPEGSFLSPSPLFQIPEEHNQLCYTLQSPPKLLIFEPTCSPAQTNSEQI